MASAVLILVVVGAVVLILLVSVKPRGERRGGRTDKGDADSLSDGAAAAMLMDDGARPYGDGSDQGLPRHQGDDSPHHGHSHHGQSHQDQSPQDHSHHGHGDHGFGDVGGHSHDAGSHGGADFGGGHH
jgi:hypothetical protein